ncbi:MAG: uroporphyrinogen-III C-methyltransferase [Gammaproteobacteria bacterium]|nr:uroporphyrinogen-III C-methyltransferase [Gammaproteobacteria bacterium]MBU1447149.1 uroporphyrinogen-III C-methyltransferase [Gammaproteobacteria bacterium]MDD2929086.1 uroporphyrinogen-III C-methyltransferase [Sideroxydans sp.]MDD5471984.1 uroporphyrinogen-III C-methyltransferase [Sideroxydans sp.]
MNEEKPSDTTATAPDKVVEAPRAAPESRVASVVSRMSLTQLTLVVLVVIFIWQWLDAHNRINQLQETVAQRLTEVAGSNQANQTLLAQTQEQVRDLGGKLSLLENRFAETQAQRAILDALYQDISSNRDVGVLADVEQVLLVADQQLHLSANVKAALIALQNADSRLQRVDRPGLAELRKRIARDIEHLRALPEVDLPELGKQIEGLIAAVDKLPLAQDVRPPSRARVAAAETADGNIWQRFWHELWQELRQLIRIEDTHQQELPLLSPEQSFFLRENVKLRLLTAKLALLTHDQTGFRRELKTVQAWLNRYCDNTARDTQQALQGVEKLAAAAIAVDLPDISPTLDAVRNYRAAQERSAK